ncbi:Cnl2/NKP2 family protein-domain-containing protein [Coniella lustricola]|uniref:Cnl2/NKP2 family protein-domain-containing protein n=1 Tax=Coniella lustricola TaxID=2025994 RepID=A0A2T2ZSN9_9PEZI|nr:Cnl2/NKP2 family protein-domain-containing protein [Coniella lustricola]
MAPTEAAILTNYLLLPAQLPAIITLKEFTELFPRAQQSSPHVRRLYRDLQIQRNALIDDVASDIEHEAKRGKVLRREALRANREAESQELDDELEIERALYGSKSGVSAKRHNIRSIIPELDSAADELEAAAKRLEDEEAELLQSIKQTVGSLSDLRYGRLSNAQLSKQVLDGLQTVQETCEAAR